jgi:mRNA interferase MazF
MTIQRSEIYFVNLNPVQGREQAGQRPVLVLSIDAINRLPLVITVIVGTKGSNITQDYLTNVRVSPEESGLPLETVFLGFQVRSLDARRFPDQPAGRISDTKMLEIENVVRYCLGL